jgi:hypothetical protein
MTWLIPRRSLLTVRQSREGCRGSVKVPQMTSRSAPMLATRTSSKHITSLALPHREPGKNVRKKLLVKIFAGPIWEGRLVEFVGVFTKRRDEFKLALTIHTTVGVDAANLKLDIVNELTAEVSRKHVLCLFILSVKEVLTAYIRTDVMLQLFKEFITPQQRELVAKVEKKGGDAALRSKEAMEELASDEYKITAPLGSQNDGGCRFDLIELEQEIKGDPNKAIEKNTEVFYRKFEVQRREIEDIVHREGDRIILAVKEGPHDRVDDPVRRAKGPSLCMTHNSPFTSGYP